MCTQSNYIGMNRFLNGNLRGTMSVRVEFREQKDGWCKILGILSGLATILGNIAGTIVIFGTALILIFLEYSEINRFTQGCIATASANDICFPVPSAFARYCIYASIALAQVFGLFLWSLRAEQKIRNRDVSPEWR